MPLKDLHVLVADDDPTVRAMTAEMLDELVVGSVRTATKMAARTG